jgi:hypothetical protein
MIRKSIIYRDIPQSAAGFTAGPVKAGQKILGVEVSVTKTSAKHP